jgi:hypothetical protein
MEKYFQILSLQEEEIENGRKRKRLLPYKDGPNFAFEPKKCPHCAEKMIRLPLDVHYLKFSTGCILVNIIKGKMVVTNVEPSYIYSCTNCTYSETRYKDGPQY